MSDTATPHRIGMITAQLFHTYWALLAHGVRTRAAELGVALVEPETDFDDDREGAIEDILGRRPAVLIAARNVTRAQADLPQRCQAAGVQLVTADEDWTPGIVGAVQTDEAQGAELALGLLLERIGGQGSVVHIHGEENARYAAFQQMLARAPGVRLGFAGDGHWSVAEGRRVMREALAACPEVRGVFAHNDDLAIGAADALAEAGLSGQVTVVGFDGTPAGLYEIRRGRLAASVFRNSSTLGRVALETAIAVASGRAVERKVKIPSQLITRDNLADAMLDTIQVMPQLLQNLLQSAKAGRMQRDAVIEAQRTLIQDLSAPIIPLSDRTLLVPLVGAIDSARAAQIIDSLLGAVSRQSAEDVLIDITGVPVIDTSIAHHLLRATRAARLLGARVMLVGISPEIAQTIVQLGVDLGDIATFGSLQAGLAQIRQAPARRATRT